MVADDVSAKTSSRHHHQLLNKYSPAVVAAVINDYLDNSFRIRSQFDLKLDVLSPMLKAKFIRARKKSGLGRTDGHRMSARREEGYRDTEVQTVNLLTEHHRQHNV